VCSIDDVLDDDDVPSANIGAQPDQFMYFPGRSGAAVRGDFDERRFAVQRDALHQLGHEHERTVEYADEKRRLSSGIILIDTVGDPADRIADTPVGYGEPEIFVVKPDRFHGRTD
jgi:hypothetical protein